MKKIAFYTLGCKVNQSDTASMEKLFRDAGFQIVDFEEPADICLINTCVVTNMGQSKSRKIIHRAARRDPKPLIVVTGCYPQTSPDEVVHIDGVDLIIGNQDRSKVVELVRERLGESPDEAPINAVHDLPVGREFEELDAAVDASRNRAFLKIQEGCDQYCAYCIIPYARGHLRSRSLDNIREEVAKLTAEQYKEIVLIGIHLGCYGKEIPGGPHLSDAVKAALSVPGVPRFRLGSLESVEVEDELLKLMVENPRLCAHRTGLVAQVTNFIPLVCRKSHRRARHKCLHLQVGGSHQRTRGTAKVDALIPLVDMVCLDEPQLRQRHQIYHPQSALHLQRQMQRRRQHLSALPRPTEDAQAGFPAQKVFSMRMGLQDLPQGRSSFDSGAHPSIERRGLANIGRQNLPIWLPQNIAIPKGDFQEHEFLVYQFRAFLPGRSGSPRLSAFRWRRLPERFPSITFWGEHGCLFALVVYLHFSSPSRS